MDIKDYKDFCLSKTLEQSFREKEELKKVECDLTKYSYNIWLESIDPMIKLQKENRTLRERVAYLERSIERKEDTIYGLRDDVVQLDIIIHKAIDYIVSRSIKAGVELMPREKELIKILKGDNNEN